MALRLLAHLRAVKSLRELALMRRAAGITSETFSKIPQYFREGVSERALAGKIAVVIEDLGAEALAFPVIAAFGSNTAHVHHEPTSRRLKENEIVMLDFGAVVGGYCSDMTRTFFFGKPTKKFALWHGRVLEAQRRAIAKIKDGARASEIDRAARSYLARFASKKHFPHGTGHGVGLAIHEWPRIGPKSRDILRKGMVATVEPGIYLRGWGGIRIEDMVLVRKNGCEILTSF